MHVSGRFLRGAIVAATATALVAGGTDAAGAAAAHHRGRVILHVTKAGRVHAPATTRPGRAHLHATGDEPVLLVKRNHTHKSVSTLVKDLNRSSPAKLLRDFTFVAMVQDGYLTLTSGTYYVIGLAEHLSAGKVATMKVTGKRSSATLPATTTYRVGGHGALHVPGSQSRHHDVRFVNQSSTPQELVMFGIAKDTAQRDIDAYLAHPTEDNLDKLDIVDFAFPVLIGGHRQLVTNAHLHARRYLVGVAPLTSTSDDMLAHPRLITVH